MIKIFSHLGLSTSMAIARASLTILCRLRASYLVIRSREHRKTKDTALCIFFPAYSAVA